jgi:hypothetical protein
MKIVKNERISLLARSHGYFPTAFRWRGRRFDVIAVEKCWMERRPAARRMFRVRCAAGSFVLEQSVANDAWWVSRRPLALLLWPHSGPEARFPLPRRQRRPARQAPAGRLAQLAAPAQVHAAAAQDERRQSWTPASQRL